MRHKKRQVLSMRKIKEILRLSLQCKLGQREIARSCKVSHVTVRKYVIRAKEISITYKQVEEMDELKLYSLLKIKVRKSSHSSKPQPDWNYVHQELKRPNVTLQLLWEEYKTAHSEGYQLSQFCYL
jgi:transposase